MGPLEPPPRPGARSTASTASSTSPAPVSATSGGRRRTSTRSSPPAPTRRTPWRARSRRPTTPCGSSRGSAVGYYGDRGDEELTEASPPGRRLLPRRRPGLGGRRRPRRRGGCLGGLRPHRHRAGRRGTAPVAAPDAGPARASAGPIGWRPGSSGPGSRWPTRSARSSTCSTGPRSPGPSTSRARSGPPAEVAAALGRALHRPAFFPAPPSPCASYVGEFAGEILGGRRIVGDVLGDSGYAFQHADLDTAVRWLVA